MDVDTNRLGALTARNKERRTRVGTRKEDEPGPLNRNLLLAGGIPFPGSDGSFVYSANVTIAGRYYSDETLDNLIRGRLAFKFAMPTKLFKRNVR